jgi:hypothetical protein
VIYVMGAGRSGSTILGVTLGNCDGLFFAGELDKWLARSGIPQLKDPERVQFWEEVRGDVDGAGELFGYATQCLERSSALFRIRAWPARRRLRKRYRRVSENLYQAIAGETGADCIVDTSHYPLRARELQSLSGVDLFLLLLVRDPRRVVASLNRRDVAERRFNAPTAHAYLWLTYLVSLFVFLRHRRDRRLFVSHEDFIADPATVVAQILKLIESPAAIPDFRSLRTGLAFQGNRLLGSDVLALKSTPGPETRSSRVSALLQLPWTIVFARLRNANVARSAD